MKCIQIAVDGLLSLASVQSQFPFCRPDGENCFQKHLKIQGTERMFCAVTAGRMDWIGREKAVWLYADSFFTCTALSCGEVARQAGRQQALRRQVFVLTLHRGN